ncbi:hypothetical protein FRC17_003088 [Serendipita sp. 399]|nr:hypothetical protein FRC17_003088 [Serendipita sp. 399]
MSSHYMGSSNASGDESSDTSADGSGDEVESTPDLEPYNVAPQNFYDGFGKTFPRYLDVVMRSPTRPEIDIASLNVKEGLKALENLELELDRARAKVAELEQQRKRLKKDIHVNQSISSNLRTIPDEVLSVIFEFYGGSPWILMGVCRQWRVAATHTRGIWSKIRINVGFRRSQHDVHRWTNGENCCTPALLQMALDRAGGTQLDIRIDHLSSEGGDFNAFLDRLKANKAYLRIYALNLQCCPVIRLNDAKLEEFEFPILEKAYLAAAAVDLYERIRKTAPRLRFLDLIKAKEDQLDWDLSSMYQLEELRIRGGYSHGCGYEAILMISSAPRLTTLRMWRTTIWSSPEHGIPSIPSLQSLYLDAVTIKSKLSLPGLKVLVLQNSRIANDEAHPLVLPSLISLQIDSPRPDHDLYIHTPTLDSLHLKFDYDSGQTAHLVVEKLLQSSIGMGQMSPRSFRLHAGVIEAQTILDILTHLPRLEEWDFTGTIASPKSFFDKMAGRCLGSANTRATNKVPLCPSMRSIRFKIESHRFQNSTATIKATEKWYEEAIRARKKGRYPIKQSFIWEDDSNGQRRAAAACKNYMESSDSLEDESSDASEDDTEDEAESTPNTKLHNVAPKSFYNGLGKGDRANDVIQTFPRYLDVVIRSPTSSDVEVARYNVKEGVEALANLELELEQARAGVVELEKRRERLKEDIHVNRSISSNLRTIPDEVLSVIFEFYVDTPYSPGPWRLMAVCRQWRAAAIQTRRIWSKILIKVGYNPHHLSSRWNEREICYTPALLQEALDRAGGAQLDIKIDINGSGGRELNPFIDQLRAKRAYLRMHALHTQRCSVSQLKKANFEGFEFPILERAYLTAAAVDIHERIKKMAPRLRCLELHKLHEGQLDWDLSSMHQLEDLLIYGGYRKHHCGVEAILMISSAPRLTTLQLMGITIPSSPGQEIPTLLTLHLEDATINCKLDLPGLRTLIMLHSKVANDKTHPFTLPSLMTLKIDSATLGDDLCIHAPALESLELGLRDSTTGYQPVIDRVFGPSVFMGEISPHCFRLHADSIKAQELVTVLTHMPHLEKWTFEGTITSPKSFFDKLAGRSLGGTTNRATSRVPLCPSMTTILFDIRSRHSVNAANVKQLYEETIRVRRGGRYSIKNAFFKESESRTFVKL